jgi:hypothetical protein
MSSRADQNGFVIRGVESTLMEAVTAARKPGSSFACAASIGALTTRVVQTAGLRCRAVRNEPALGEDMYDNFVEYPRFPAEVDRSGVER